MKIKHPAVTSDVFKLVTTLEFDLQLRGQFMPTRVELFQNTERKRHFRCHLWELEYYHIQGTFSAGRKANARRPASDEPIFVERTWELSSKFHDFTAPNAQAAMKKFLDILAKYLERVSPG